MKKITENELRSIVEQYGQHITITLEDNSHIFVQGTIYDPDGAQIGAYNNCRNAIEVCKIVSQNGSYFQIFSNAFSSIKGKYELVQDEEPLAYSDIKNKYRMKDADFAEIFGLSSDSWKNSSAKGRYIGVVEKLHELFSN